MRRSSHLPKLLVTFNRRTMFDLVKFGNTIKHDNPLEVAGALSDTGIGEVTLNRTSLFPFAERNLMY